MLIYYLSYSCIKFKFTLLRHLLKNLHESGFRKNKANSEKLCISVCTYVFYNAHSIIYFTCGALYLHHCRPQHQDS